MHLSARGWLAGVIAIAVAGTAVAAFAFWGPGHLLAPRLAAKVLAPVHNAREKQCAAPMPDPQASPNLPQPKLIKLPVTVWVNPAVGANLRAAPSVSATSLALLYRGTEGRADQTTKDGSGTAWYRVTSGGRTGWVRGDLLYFEPIIQYKGSKYRLPGWSLIVPNSSLGVAQGQYVQMQSGALNEPYWFLMIQTASDASSLPTPMPYIIGAVYPALYDRTERIKVGKYRATKRVVRGSFDICKFGDNFLEKIAGGWAYVTSVQVVTPNRAYQLLFATDRLDAPIVQKVLDSTIVT
jgi:hypothetical protein